MSTPTELATHVTTHDAWTILVMGDDLAQVNELKLETAREALNDAAERALADDGKKLLIDMTRCTFFGSSFIQAVFQTWKKVNAAGGAFAVCGCNANIREVFEITRLDSVWPIYDTRDEALTG